MQALAPTAKRYWSTAILVVFLAAIALPSILASYVSAAQVTTRSIQLSSAAPSATAVEYTIRFTAPTSGSNIKGMVIDFCSESPILGTACTTPAGLIIPTASPTVTGINGAGTWTATNTAGAFRLTNTSGTTPSGPITIVATGFTNPSATGPFYGRIFTYATDTPVGAYTSTVPGASVVDSGGVAMSITQTIGVTATVRETLTFCVSKAAPTASCGGTNSPAVVLGTGSPASLESSTVAQDTAHFQLSTNASGATTVYIKGSSINLVAGSSNIPGVNHASAPQTLATATANGNFGFRTANIAGGTGTVTLDTHYASATANQGNMQSAVTATYGDDVATTTGPVADKNVQLTFVAVAGTTTPAGIYTGNYSLIATPSY